MQILNEKEFLAALAKRSEKKPNSKQIIFKYKSHISSALKEGYSFTEIFNFLKENELYPYSYNSFIRALKLIIVDNGQAEDKSNATPKIISEKLDTFEFNPIVKNIEDLI